MRTKEQLKEVVQMAINEPNSKAFLRREMHILKDKYYYENLDFLNDSLDNVAKIMIVKEREFDRQKTSMRHKGTDRAIYSRYVHTCVLLNEGISFEEYWKREAPKVRKKITDEIKVLTDQYEVKKSKCLRITEELKELKNDLTTTGTSTTLTTDLSEPRMAALYTYLLEEKFIKTTPEMWRYWFTKQSLLAGKNPVKIQWLGAGSVLSNVVALICGNFTNDTANAMKAAFKLSSGTKYQKPTNSRFERGKKPFKRIYEIKEHAETKLQS